MAKREWQKLNDDFSALYYANGRTDVRRESTGDIVVTSSPSLQDALIMGHLQGPLRYLFGPDVI